MSGGKTDTTVRLKHFKRLILQTSAGLNLHLLAVARRNAAVLLTELQNKTFKTLNSSDLLPVNQFLRLRCHFLLLQMRLRPSVADL